MNITNIKQYPLQQTQTYSFAYNNHIYCGQYISTKRSTDYDDFLFQEFILRIYPDDSFHVIYLKEKKDDHCFSDSDSDNNDTDDEYDMVEHEEIEYVFM